VKLYIEQKLSQVIDKGKGLTQPCAKLFFVTLNQLSSCTPAVDHDCLDFLRVLGKLQLLFRFKDLFGLKIGGKGAKKWIHVDYKTKFTETSLSTFITIY
jgi:hypothetical protein